MAGKAHARVAQDLAETNACIRFFGGKGLVFAKQNNELGTLYSVAELPIRAGGRP